MVRERLTGILDTLRLRIHRGLQLRSIALGDRLPSTRELAEELRADPRVVASAYRLLAAEGLVEIRARSGIYVSSSLTVTRTRPEPPASWLAGLFAQGISRGVSVPELPDVLRTSVSRRVRTVVVATTIDQTEGICRELRQDFGLRARGVPADALADSGGVPHAIRRAQLLITTERHQRRLRALADRLDKRLVCMTIRPDLYDTEWSLFRDHEAYVIVVDARFGRLVQDYLRSLGAAERVHILIVGKHDLSRIPEAAPVYATQAARRRLGPREVPGLLPPVRIIADDCAREIMTEVIRASME